MSNDPVMYSNGTSTFATKAQTNTNNEVNPVYQGAASVAGNNTSLIPVDQGTGYNADLTERGETSFTRAALTGLISVLPTALTIAAVVTSPARKVDKAAQLALMATAPHQ